MKDLDYLKEWKAIIKNLTNGPFELRTVPMNNKDFMWFSASTDGEKIYIDKALKRKPSCKITSTRVLKYETFKNIYPIYLRREKGEKVSVEASSVTVDKSYYYTLIKYMCD